MTDLDRLYPETIEAAFASDDEIAEAMERLEAAGVEFVMSCWIDILGSPKTKPVPLSELPALCRGKGPQFAVHSVTMHPELGPADPDQIPVPDLSSIHLCPWDPTLAFVYADLFFEGAPYDVCPRLILKRQIRAAAEAGYKFFAGMEPEFIVMEYDSDGQPAKAIDDDPPPGRGLRPKRQAFGYDVEYTLDSMPYLADMSRHIDTLGWELKNVVCEGGYSQFELDFGYTDLLAMADRFTFLRTMVKEVAKQHGMFATFMPKPAQGDWRNGAHINWSVQPVDRPGENLFEANGDWSELAFQAVAGIVRHGVAVTAVNCSTVNSYKGLIGRAREFEGGTVTWAPTHIVHGHNNRSAMLRLPQPRFAIENRAVDMYVNPYLALALTGAASLEGMTKRLKAPPPVEESLYDIRVEGDEAELVRPLPRTLAEAIDGFEADELAKAVFGSTLHGLFVRHKRDEWNRYHEWVSDWEVREYLRFL